MCTNTMCVELFFFFCFQKGGGEARVEMGGNEITYKNNEFAI